MTQTTQFTIGAEARCSDGVCGEVTRVVVNPVAETVTHLVVAPKHRHDAGRLVPLRLVRSAGEDIQLGCTVAEFDTLELAEETHFLPGDGGYSAYGVGQAYVWPYWGLGGGGMGGGAGMWAAAGTGGGAVGPVTTDTVPDDEIAIYRGDPVHATDGEIGHVRGLVIDTASHHVTHVLLHEGHLFGRKDVAIPIGAVSRTDDGIRLTITKRQVEELPPVDLDPVGSTT